MSVSNLAHTLGRDWAFDCKQGRRPGEPRCLINTARFCVLRARPRCGLPPSSRVKPAPAWSCLNAGIRHAQNPALWRSAGRSSGKTRGRRGSGGNKGVGFDEDGSCADQRRAALNAGMGDVLKIIRRGAIIVQRGSHGSDRHPISAMQAGKEETRQVRRGNVLIAHSGSPGSGSSRFHFPIVQRKSQQIFVQRTMFVHRQWLCGLENPVWMAGSRVG
jgi:hypothetical protein